MAALPTAAAPNSGSVVHGLEHVVDQLADSGIDLFDRLGDFAEPFVRQDQDFAHGHGGDVSGSPKWVNVTGISGTQGVDFCVPADFAPRNFPARRHGVGNALTL